MSEKIQLQATKLSEEELVHKENQQRDSVYKIFSYENDGELILRIPDALVALSGSIEEVDSTTSKIGHQRHQSPPFLAHDNNGLASGGKARVIATAFAQKFFPEAAIVTGSRDYEQEGTTRPTHASVYKAELVRYGVAKEKIIVEEESRSTFENLVSLIALAVEHNWKTVAIITSDYHTQRVEVMFEKLAELIQKSERSGWSQEEKDAKVAQLQLFLSSGGVVCTISAEKILSIAHPLASKVIESVKTDEAYAKRIAMEEKGVRQIREGTYKV